MPRARRAGRFAAAGVGAGAGAIRTGRACPRVRTLLKGLAMAYSIGRRLDLRRMSRWPRAPRPRPGCPRASFPSKTIQLVVPFPAGGATDTLARLLAEKMSPRLGQAVVVDNKAGAAGIIGTDAVAKAPPDGYTLSVSLSTQPADQPVPVQEAALQPAARPRAGVADRAGAHRAAGASQRARRTPARAAEIHRREQGQAVLRLLGHRLRGAPERARS